VKLIADKTVAIMSDFVCGANKPKMHLTGVNFGRDLPEPMIVADVRNVVEGDASPDGKGKLSLCRGIEVGHIFQLGAKYSQAMNATYLDEEGKSQVMQMGCYGIGVTRIVGAAIEQNHDDRGMVWPVAMAPFEAVICAVGWGKSEAVRHAATELYDALRAVGVDVILDDRDFRPGVMFAEWELIGVPVRLTVGDRGLANGEVELMARRDTQPALVKLEQAVASTQAALSH
jgi:prolyl-tRNA synthetase